MLWHVDCHYIQKILSQAVLSTAQRWPHVTHSLHACPNVVDCHHCCCSDPSLGPPADTDALQVAYEAGMWQLLELFFLSDDTQEGFFAEAFCAWLAEHGGLLCSTPGYNALAAEARRLGDSARVDNDPSYWPTVQRLVLLGQLEVAAQLLMAHTAYQNLQVPAMAAKVSNM